MFFYTMRVVNDEELVVQPLARTREAISDAIRAKTDESPAIKSKMDDVAEAVAIGLPWKPDPADVPITACRT